MVSEMSPELIKAIAAARHWQDNATDEVKEAMWAAQRKSWCAGPHGPTDGMGTVYFPALSGSNQDAE